MGYLEEKENLEKISKHLDRLGIPYKHQDLGKDSEIVFPALLCTYRFENKHNFDVIIYSIGKWINIKCLVLKKNRIEPNFQTGIYELCLQLNYDLPEVTFSTNKGDIYIEMDALVESSFEDFTEEFKSIPLGIGQLIEIIQKNYGIEIVDTEGEAHKK
ncbi:MAG: hypothetical protein DRO88_09505 [Promethearchaeia archaeon]|nr:MAG: hypothetical protein DRO88_09505 [Candidatus Lokiarchaeia archaeon]